LKRYILFFIITLLLLHGESRIDLWGVDLGEIEKDKIDREESIEVKFEEDYDIAQSRAVEENRYIFLLITEKSCGWCRKLKREVLKDVDVAERLNSRYISIEVDREEGYYPPTIGVQGTPSIFILNPEDNSTIESVAGYRDSRHLLEILDRVEKR